MRNNHIIRFDDRLVYHGSYHLTPRAIKTIYYIVSRFVDPEARSLPGVITVPIAELIQALSNGKSSKASKYLYGEIDSLCQELIDSKITFKSEVAIQGIKLNGYVAWCSAAVPIIQNGVQCIEFVFGHYISQFLLGLSQYVRIYRPEVNRLSSGYAIRLYQILKGDRNRKEKFENKSVRTIAVSDLKFLLGIGNKYKAFKNFNRRILKPACNQINKSTSIQVLKTKYLRESGDRTVTHISFYFTDQNNPASEKNNLSNSSIADIEISKHLSKSQRNAYELLLKFDIKPEIALHKIIPEIKGTESQGFEDYFIEKSLEHFRSTAKNQLNKKQAAATFVSWWTKHKIFDTASDVWTKINERVVEAKRQLQDSQPEHFQNRLIAKDMTEADFVSWYQQGNNVIPKFSKNLHGLYS